MYLESQLSGEAVQITEGLSTTEANFKIATDLLEKYGDKQQIVQKLYEKQHSISKATDKLQANVEPTTAQRQLYGLSIKCTKTLKEIKSYLHKLNTEKETRYSIYVETIEEIEELLSDLEISIASNFDQTALDKNNEFKLSVKHITALQEWKNHLINQKESENQLISELRDKIGLLWDKLDINSLEHEEFIVKPAKKCGKSVLKELHNELMRCETLKKSIIKTDILRLRNNIAHLQDRCYIAKEERNVFHDFYSTDYNEDLLKSHKKQAEELQKFYNKTSIIYDLAEKWFNLWNKIISLENQSNNLERLNNRHGQLLKEECKRKRL